MAGNVYISTFTEEELSYFNDNNDNETYSLI